MKHDWEYKRLGEVGSFQRGKGIQKTHFVTNGMPCIHYGQIHTTFGVSTLNHISEIPQDLYEQSIIASKGDVLLALTSEDVEGSCKSTAWLGDYDVAISSDAAVFKHNLNPKFVVYYTQTKAFFIEKSKYARGFKVTHIKTSDIETIPIPVPSIEIQSLIVSELDSLSQIIEDCKETLKDYDALEQSIFYDMFGDPVKNDKGWEVKKLGDCCLKIGSGATPKGGDSAYKEEGISLIRSLNVHNDGFRYKDLAFIDEDQAKALSNVQIEPLDVLLNITGASVARCCIVPNDVIPARVNQHVSILRCNQDVIAPTFLSFQLKSAEYQTVLLTISRSNGATREALTKQQQQNFDVILPPLPLQQQFASKIKAIEKMKAETKKALQEAETLFNARMDYWFN